MKKVAAAPALTAKPRTPVELVSGLAAELPSNLYIQSVKGDGNCLFYAVCSVMGLPPGEHVNLRRDTGRVLRAFPNKFLPFISGHDAVDFNYESYVVNVERLGTYVDNPEVTAACIARSINLMIHQLGQKSYLIETDPSAPTYHVAYYGREYEHYDAIHPRRGAAAKSPSAKLPAASPAAMTGVALPEKPVAKLRLSRSARRRARWALTSDTALAAVPIRIFTGFIAIAVILWAVAQSTAPASLHGELATLHDSLSYPAPHRVAVASLLLAAFFALVGLWLAGRTH